MPTLILPPRFTTDTNSMRAAALAAGWDVERLGSWRVDPSLRKADPVLYGEPLFAAVVANSLGLTLLEPAHDWLARLSPAWTKREIQYSTLAQARTACNKFIKPAVDKCFVARVYADGSELPGDDVLPSDTPVLLAEPVSWAIEFRCFVLKGECVAISPYLRHGQLAQAPDGTWPAEGSELTAASDFLTAFLAQHAEHLPPAVVVDVGEIVGRGWAVIEANAAWGSGIYGCEPTEVLNVLRHASVPEEPRAQ